MLFKVFLCLGSLFKNRKVFFFTFLRYLLFLSRNWKKKDFSISKLLLTEKNNK